MLDVIAQLEAAGMETEFRASGDGAALLGLAQAIARTTGAPMACLIMTPDDGETEPQEDRRDQDDADDQQDPHEPDADQA